MAQVASSDEFWSLLAESRLMSAAQCERARGAAWRRLGGRDAEPLEAARQLVAKGMLTKYQAKVLLAGRPGPFLTGGYKVLEPVEHGRLRRLLRATHLSTGHPVLLHVASTEKLAKPTAYRPVPVHRHIAKRYETFPLAASNYAAFENLRGFSGKELLQFRRLEPADAIFFAYQAALGLAAWHEQSGPWGDFGLKNLFVTENDRAVLLPPPLTRRLRERGETPTREQDLADWGKTFAELLLGREAVAGRRREGLLDAAREAAIPDPAIDALAASLPAPGLHRMVTASGVAELLAPLTSQRVGGLDSSDAAATALAYEDWIARNPRQSALERPVSAPPPHKRSPDPTAPQPSRRRRPQPAPTPEPPRAWRRWAPFAAISVAGLIVAGGAWAMKSLGPRSSPESLPQIFADEPIAAPIGDRPVGDEPSPTRPEVELVDDDGRTLWAAPEVGRPWELRGLPPGAAWLIHVRPQALQAAAGGQSLSAILATLGWDVHAQLAATGAVVADLQRAIIGCHLRAGDVVENSYLLVGPANAFPAPDESQMREHAGTSYFLRGELAWYVAPTTDEGDAWALAAPEELVREAIDAGFEPPLRRDLAELVAELDDAALLQFAGAPRALFTAGREALSGPLSELRQGLERSVRTLEGDQLSAVALTVQAAPRFDYLEFRATTTTGVRPVQALARLDDAFAGAIDAAVEAANTPERAHLALFPPVLRASRRYVRTGVDGDQIVMRAYLPPRATARLVDGSVRLLFGVAATPPAAETPSAAEVATVDDLLDQTIGLQFPRDSFVSGLEQLTELTGLRIAIAGEDLKTVGVTQNQQMEIDAAGATVRDVLLEMLRKADPSGKLVVVQRGDAGEETLVVTTRTAAVERGESFFPESE